MAVDGIQYNEHTQDSTAPVLPVVLFDPTNFRSMIQKQIQVTVDNAVSAIQGLSVGNFSGKYLTSFPGETQRMQNSHGRFYHVVGLSVVGDQSVAAP